MRLYNAPCVALVNSVFAAALLLAADAPARDIYVSNAIGNDLLSGLTSAVSGKDGPVRTINRGLAIAQRSDRVLVANTGIPYREEIAISGSCLGGTERRPFILQSDGAVIDGTVIAERGAWRPVDGELFAFRPRRLTYQQLFKDGKPLPRAPLGQVLQDKSLAPLRWAITQDAVLMRVETGKLPRDYAIRHAGLQTGITLYNTRYVIIDGFVVQGFQQDGVNAHEMALDCTLRNLECRANGRSGLSVGGVSRVGVENSRFYDNGRVQVRTEQASRLRLAQCDVDTTKTPGYLNRGRELTVDGQRALAR